MQCVVTARTDNADWLLAFKARVVNVGRTYLPRSGDCTREFADLSIILSTHGIETIERQAYTSTMPVLNGVSPHLRPNNSKTCFDCTLSIGIYSHEFHHLNKSFNSQEVILHHCDISKQREGKMLMTSLLLEAKKQLTFSQILSAGTFSISHTSIPAPLKF